MTTTKTLFHGRENAISRDKLKGLVKAEWFQIALVYALSDVSEGGKLTSEELAGALKYKSALLNLPEDELESHEYPSPGLNHDLDSPTTEKNQKKEEAHG